jgi:PPOX class probable F420-dependent enzyme
VSAPSPSRALSGREVFADPLVRELLDARSIAVLATIDPDGAVHAVAIWFAARGDELVLATGSGSRKVRNLERDDRATIVLHDSRPGVEVCGVTMRGRAVIERGSAAAPLVAEVHRRYVEAAGLALPQVETFLGGDDVALRFRPDSATTWDERGSDAARVLREAGLALPLVPTSPR